MLFPNWPARVIHLISNTQAPEVVMPSLFRVGLKAQKKQVIFQGPCSQE